ncbi:MAG: hypothetical protein OEU80_11135, partial [Deltaproteobacteria bacterium]|nr:hypothetical protein [Deltaproteobacteria bacterium]
ASTSLRLELAESEDCRNVARMGEIGLINSKPKYRSKLRLGTPVIVNVSLRVHLAVRKAS